jgi:hypothetical protein
MLKAKSRFHLKRFRSKSAGQRSVVSTIKQLRTRAVSYCLEREAALSFFALSHFRMGNRIQMGNRIPPPINPGHAFPENALVLSLRQLDLIQQCHAPAGPAHSRGRGNPAFAKSTDFDRGKGWVPASAGTSGQVSGAASIDQQLAGLIVRAAASPPPAVIGASPQWAASTLSRRY